MRFRPIMMTTMAAFAGTLPIALGIGAGAETRRPLGLAVVGGLVVSQILTLYLTPVIYLYMNRLQDRLAPAKKLEARPAHSKKPREPIGGRPRGWKATSGGSACLVGAASAAMRLA